MLLAAVNSATAKDITIPEASITALDVARTERKLFVTMNIDMTQAHIAANRELIVTPLLTAENDTLRLPEITFAGRNRYYNHLRNSNETNPYMLPAGDKACIDYQVNVDYQPWMNRAEINLSYEMRACGSCTIAGPRKHTIAVIDMQPQVFVAEFLYIPPCVETEKVREEKGSAFIDFAVNRTDINPSYRNNAAELDKIITTIDLIRNDKDMDITGMSIHGYASPEGPYKNNVRLAKGRTQALKQYVTNLYHFDPAFIDTAYTAEDWEGLRLYVMNSSLDNRQAIMDIIDSPLDPDAKDAAIKRAFPADYAFLLKNEYPALRHSDYVVEYKVRSYYDPAEILSLMRTAPQKLSLAELYAAAQTLDPGSDEFNEVFEVAVRMYPADPVANLNAANAAIAAANYKAARRYLDAAGESPEAEYARGLLCAHTEMWDEAKEHFTRALSIPQAKTAIETVDRVVRSRKNPINIQVK